MKTILTGALALSLIAGGAFARPMFHHQHHRVCGWHHHHRVCR